MGGQWDHGTCVAGRFAAPRNNCPSPTCCPEDTCWGSASWGQRWPSVALGLGTSHTMMSGITRSSTPLSLLSHLQKRSLRLRAVKFALRSQDSTPVLWDSNNLKLCVL